MEERGTSASWEEVNVGSDLIHKAQELLDFLADVDKHPALYEGRVLNRAIRRYESVWLPLAATHSGSRHIAPPLDIHWVWFCHMVAPLAYKTDCFAQVSALIEHEVLSRRERIAAQDNTRLLWQRSTHIPYDVDLDQVGDDHVEYEQICQYDLKAASARLQDFYYQVSLPHFWDELFLQNGLIRYRKMLHLATKHPGQTLVPCYDIDVVWFTHLLHPGRYDKDTTALFGSMFNHADFLCDRRLGAKLATLEQETRDLWQQELGEEQRCAGAMYRSPAPRHDLKPMTKQNRTAVCPKIIRLVVNEVYLNGAIRGDKTLHVIVRSSGHKSKQTTLVKANLTNKEHQRNDNQDKGLGSASVDTRSVVELCVALHVKAGIHKEKYVGHFPDFATQVQSCTDKMVLETKITLSDSVSNQESLLSVTVRGVLNVKTIQDCVLRSKSGPFTEMTLASSILANWGCRSLMTAPLNSTDKCYLASHILQDVGNKNEAFGCLIMHSIPHNMSAVRISYCERTVAAAHLVYSSHLPTPKQVSGAGMTLDSGRPERVMLVTDCSGDRALIKSIWRSHKSDSSNSKRAEIGYLEVTIQDIITGRASTKIIQPHSAFFESDIDFNTFTVNFGTETINTGTEDNAVNLCMAYAVAVLYALCEPRRVDPEGQRVHLWETGRNESILGYNWPMIIAAGYECPCPSNSYLMLHKNQFPERRRSSAQSAKDVVVSGLKIDGSPRRNSKTGIAQLFGGRRGSRV